MAESYITRKGGGGTSQPHDIKSEYVRATNGAVFKRLWQVSSSNTGTSTYTTNISAYIPSFATTNSFLYDGVTMTQTAVEVNFTGAGYSNGITYFEPTQIPHTQPNNITSLYATTGGSARALNGTAYEMLPTITFDYDRYRFNYWYISGSNDTPPKMISNGNDFEFVPIGSNFVRMPARNNATITSGILQVNSVTDNSTFFNSVYVTDNSGTKYVPAKITQIGGSSPLRWQFNTWLVNNNTTNPILMAVNSSFNTSVVASFNIVSLFPNLPGVDSLEPRTIQQDNDFYYIQPNGTSILKYHKNNFVLNASNNNISPSIRGFDVDDTYVYVASGDNATMGLRRYWKSNLAFHSQTSSGLMGFNGVHYGQNVLVGENRILFFTTWAGGAQYGNTRLVYLNKANINQILQQDNFSDTIRTTIYKSPNNQWGYTADKFLSSSFPIIRAYNLITGQFWTSYGGFDINRIQTLYQENNDLYVLGSRRMNGASQSFGYKLNTANFSIFLNAQLDGNLAPEYKGLMGDAREPFVYASASVNSSNSIVRALWKSNLNVYTGILVVPNKFSTTWGGWLYEYDRKAVLGIQSNDGSRTALHQIWNTNPTEFYSLNTFNNTFI